jgi:hypothetical protein
VNWNVTIMGLKFLDASGSGTTADAIVAIDFAVNAKIAGVNVRVLSNSWGGGPFEQALMDEINKANTNDILFVAAAGNSASNNDVTPHYPSSYNTPNMVAVAATDNRDGLASFSNFGPTSVHLGAPGVDVLSTLPNSTYDYLSGTSMATPHVSGAAALILSRQTLTTAQLKSAILSNVDPNPALAGLTTTGGRLNVCKAIPGCGGAPTPDFSLGVSPSSQTVVQGSTTGAYTVSITRTGGFTGAVTFSTTGLPTGATPTFSPNPASGASSSLTIATAASTAAGTYPFTISGTSGTLTRTTSATLVVTVAPTPDFSLGVSPSSQTVVQGSTTGAYTVSITRTGGFTGAVTFSTTGLPTGATPSFNPNPASGASSSLTIATTASTAAGTYPFTISGVSGSLTRTTSATLVVTTPTTGDYSLSVSPSSQTVSAGMPTSYTVNIARTGGFGGAVTLSASGLPAGASASFNPNPATGANSTLNVTTSATTPTGTFSVTIAGSSTLPPRTTTATLVVTPCDQGECP